MVVNQDDDDSSSVSSEISSSGKVTFSYIGSVSVSSSTLNSNSDSSDSLRTQIKQWELDQEKGKAEREPSGGAKKQKMTRRQRLTLTTFCIMNFSSSLCVSLQAPFYPAEAESKGVTSTQYGLVFGVFQLTMFIVSPFYGKYMTKIGAKFMWVSGIFILSVCCILFGFLDKVNGTNSFLALSFAIRILEATGNAAYVTAGFSIIAREFPDSVATVFGLLETFFGLGIIAGPTVGGALYELGGFTLPFASLGIWLLVYCGIAYLILPDQDEFYDSSKKSSSFLSLVKVPAVSLSVLPVFTSACSIGFLSAILEPHLRQFHLSPFQVGLMFIVNGVVYGITTPFWGKLCDRLDYAKLFCATGGLFGCICWLLIGPAPFLPVSTTLPLCIVALVFDGLSLGGEIVCGFIDALRECIKNGFPDNISTYAMISSLYTSFFALGALIGPSVAGFLFERVGFRDASLFMLILHGSLAVILISYFYYSRRRRSQRKWIDENTKLIVNGIHK